MTISPQNRIGCNIRPNMRPGGFTHEMSGNSKPRVARKSRQITNATVKARCDEALAKRGLADQMTYR